MRIFCTNQLPSVRKAATVSCGKQHPYLQGRLHALVFTETAGGIRVIGFRKSNKREVLIYEQEAKLGGRGPQKAAPKVSTTIRLSADVVQAFRSGGDGWQTRMDAALKDWLRTHSAV